MSSGKESTTPADQDSDQDLLTDDEEIFKHGTDPFDADTDQDGAPDHVEVEAGSDPLDPTSIPGEHS